MRYNLNRCWNIKLRWSGIIPQVDFRGDRRLLCAARKFCRYPRGGVAKLSRLGPHAEFSVFSYAGVLYNQKGLDKWK